MNENVFYKCDAFSYYPKDSTNVKYIPKSSLKIFKDDQYKQIKDIYICKKRSTTLTYGLLIHAFFGIEDIYKQVFIGGGISGGDPRTRLGIKTPSLEYKQKRLFPSGTYPKSDNPLIEVVNNTTFKSWYQYSLLYQSSMNYLSFGEYKSNLLMWDIDFPIKVGCQLDAYYARQYWEAGPWDWNETLPILMIPMHYIIQNAGSVSLKKSYFFHEMTDHTAIYELFRRPSTEAHLNSGYPQRPNPDVNTTTKFIQFCTIDKISDDELSYTDGPYTTFEIPD